MNTQVAIRRVAGSRPAAALMLILGGICGAATAGAATVSDAAGVNDVPRVVVHYDASSLSTDSGARQLYSRLVKAAQQACPDQFTGSRLLSTAVQNCRDQSVARAVQQIHNSRLAAVYATSVKRG